MRRPRLSVWICALVLALLMQAPGRSAYGASGGATETIGEVVREGEKLVLAAEVEGGAGPFVYQWFKNGMPITDVDGATLRFEAVSATDAGAYAVVVSNVSGSVASAPIFISVTPAMPSRLANVSIVASTDSRIVVRFAIGGRETFGVTRVLVRAAGPALAQFGVGGALPNPMLTIQADGRMVASNDDWEGSNLLQDTVAQVGAYPFMAASRDAAVVIELPPSLYTAEVADVGGGAGAALVEIYDTSPGLRQAAPRLLGISARGRAGSGAAKLIAGFTIEGGGAVKVLLRGVGPSLGAAGDATVLANPRLTLVQGDMLIASNEEWGAGSAGEIAAAALAVGAAPLAPGSRDSAIVVTLKPGSYTAQVSAVGEGAGLALVEVYEVP